MIQPNPYFYPVYGYQPKEAVHKKEKVIRAFPEKIYISQCFRFVATDDGGQTTDDLTTPDDGTNRHIFFDHPCSEYCYCTVASLVILGICRSVFPRF